MRARVGARTAALLGVVAMVAAGCSGGDDDSDGEASGDRTDWPETLADACPEIDTLLIPEAVEEGDVDYGALATDLRDYAENGGDEISAAVMPVADAAQAVADSPGAEAEAALEEGATIDPNNLPPELEDITPGEEVTINPEVTPGPDAAAYSEAITAYIDSLAGLNTACGDAGSPLAQATEDAEG